MRRAETNLVVIGRVREQVQARSRLTLPAQYDVLAVCFGFELRPGVGVDQRVTGSRLTYDLANPTHRKFVARACAERALRLFTTRAERAALLTPELVDNLAVLLGG